MSGFMSFIRDFHLPFGLGLNRKRRIDHSEVTVPIPKLERINPDYLHSNHFQPIHHNNNNNLSNRKRRILPEEDAFQQVKRKRDNFNSIIEAFCMEQQKKQIQNIKQFDEDTDEKSKDETAHSSGSKNRSISRQDDEVQFQSSYKSQANTNIRRMPALDPIPSHLQSRMNYRKSLRDSRSSSLDYKNMASSSTPKSSIMRLNFLANSKKNYGSFLDSVVPDLYAINPPTKNLSVDTSFKRLNEFSPYQEPQQMRRRSDYNELRYPKTSAFIDLSDDNDDSMHKNMNNDSLANSSTSSIRERTKVPLIKPINSMLERTERKKCFQDSVIADICRKFSVSRLQKENEILEVSKHISDLNSETLEEEKLQQKRIDDVITNLRQTIIDDEADEKIDEFKPLTKEQSDVVRYGLHGGSQSEVLINKFNLSITRGDILTLYETNWLNDEVINFYMELIKERSASNDDLPRVHAMNTFFIPKLLESGFQGVRRWTRRVDIFSFDVIPVPVHVGKVHWCMAIINLRDKWIRYYDSMGRPNNTVLDALRRYLQEESLDKRQQPFDTSNFHIESVRNCPQQQNGSDCGVFSCMFAEFLSRDSEISFDQSHMQYFRNKMVFEIMTGRMLL